MRTQTHAHACTHKHTYKCIDEDLPQAHHNPPSICATPYLSLCVSLPYTVVLWALLGSSLVSLASFLNLFNLEIEFSNQINKLNLSGHFVFPDVL